MSVKITSNNPDMPTIESDDMAHATISFGLQQLKHYQKIGSSLKPDELAWEIRLYEYILSQPNAVQKANEYMSARRLGARLLPKREVAKKLGWKIL